MLNIKFKCGCGYNTNKIKDAIAHSDREGHTMEVAGQVKPGTSQA